MSRFTVAPHANGLGTALPGYQFRPTDCGGVWLLGGSLRWWLKLQRSLDAVGQAHDDLVAEQLPLAAVGLQRLHTDVSDLRLVDLVRRAGDDVGDVLALKDAADHFRL